MSSVFSSALSRLLHAAASLGWRSAGLPLCALRLPLLTAGSLAESRQAGVSCATFPRGSDGASPQNGFPPGTWCISLRSATQETGIASGLLCISGEKQTLLMTTGWPAFMAGIIKLLELGLWILEYVFRPENRKGFHQNTLNIQHNCSFVKQLDRFDSKSGISQIHLEKLRF